MIRCSYSSKRSKFTGIPYELSTICLENSQKFPKISKHSKQSKNLNKSKLQNRELSFQRPLKKERKKNRWNFDSQKFPPPLPFPQSRGNRVVVVVVVIVVSRRTVDPAITGSWPVSVHNERSQPWNERAALDEETGVDRGTRPEREEFVYR